MRSLALPLRHPEVAGVVVERLLAGEKPVEVELLRRQPHRLARRAVVGDRVVAEDEDLALGRLGEPGGAVDQGRLARPVRPQQPVELAVLDLERHALERLDPGRVALDQALDVEGLRRLRVVGRLQGQAMMRVQVRSKSRARPPESAVDDCSHPPAPLPSGAVIGLPEIAILLVILLVVFWRYLPKIGRKAGHGGAGAQGGRPGGGRRQDRPQDARAPRGQGRARSARVPRRAHRQGAGGEAKAGRGGREAEGGRGPRASGHGSGASARVPEASARAHHDAPSGRLRA